MNSGVRKRRDLEQRFVQESKTMAEQRITVTIDEDGKLSASTEGIKGEVCLKELENLLSSVAEVSSLSKKDEYYQKTEVSVNNQLKAGRK